MGGNGGAAMATANNSSDSGSADAEAGGYAGTGGYATNGGNGGNGWHTSWAQPALPPPGMASLPTRISTAVACLENHPAFRRIDFEFRGW